MICIFCLSIQIACMSKSIQVSKCTIIIYILYDLIFAIYIGHWTVTHVSMRLSYSHFVNMIYMETRILLDVTHEIDTSSLQCWITAFSVYVATGATYRA